MATKEGPKAPPSEKVQSLYKNLSIAAKTLNAASDELGKAISVFDGALQKLNLGISAWAEISGGEDEPDWWGRYLGYARVGTSGELQSRKRGVATTVPMKITRRFGCLTTRPGGCASKPLRKSLNCWKR